jgi:hypothetical protein
MSCMHVWNARTTTLIPAWGRSSTPARARATKPDLLTHMWAAETIERPLPSDASVNSLPGQDLVCSPCAT